MLYISVQHYVLYNQSNLSRFMVRWHLGEDVRSETPISSHSNAKWHNSVIIERSLICMSQYCTGLNVCTVEFENNVLLSTFKIVPKRPDNTGDTMKIAVSYVYTVITRHFIRVTNRRSAFRVMENGLTVKNCDWVCIWRTAPALAQHPANVNFRAPSQRTRLFTPNRFDNKAMVQFAINNATN